jgi:hypothetical protein
MLIAIHQQYRDELCRSIKQAVYQSKREQSEVPYGFVFSIADGTGTQYQPHTVLRYCAAPSARPTREDEMLSMSFASGLSRQPQITTSISIHT